ncbi:DUF4429 domain-containing protein [Pseudonocardia sp. EV170527-09]|uniref:DUF4429 domain-containing protein n=1 Tax=Pseudonocardia sp. EV170527-09 TaxID=2603411 RepID=UPI001386FA83|nr:DUF4429 domain-containing protein [Pseudonocardia sp. EV170527-09]
MDLTAPGDPGFRLNGRNASWTIEHDRVVVEYADSPGSPGLLRRIGVRTVPLVALSGVHLATGEGCPVLRLELRPGADPYLDVAAGQLRPEHHPYRLELDREQTDLAAHHARTLALHAELNPDSDRPCATYLTHAADPPARLRGYDGEAWLDEDALRFRWNGAASEAKQRAGDTVHRYAEIDRVEWVRPGLVSGHLRVVAADAAPTAPPASDDPAALLFGLGLGGLTASLLFAAALAVRTRTATADGAGPPRAASTHPAADPGRIAAAVRALDGLVADGLLDPADFVRRRDELLDRL